MTLTVGVLKKLIALAGGKTVARSGVGGAVFKEMIEDEGLLVAVGHGRSFRASDCEGLRRFVAQKYNVTDMEGFLSLLESGTWERSNLVAAAGDSKIRPRRVMTGFLVNVYSPVKVRLSGQNMELTPMPGASVFISDYESFVLPEDTVVIGVENTENFHGMSRQRALFEWAVPPGVGVICVCRYPQNGNKDLIKWLSMIPNHYIHFGDLDLQGVSIYLTEYYRSLGSRASMLIPPDYESRIKSGSRERYDRQYPGLKNMEITDSRVAKLVECIHRYHRGYDQEGFIES